LPNPLVRGVDRGARLVTGTTMLKLAPLAVFILAGASAVHGSNFALTVLPDAQRVGRNMSPIVANRCFLQGVHKGVHISLFRPNVVLARGILLPK